jgi:hypothetical protein
MRALVLQAFLHDSQRAEQSGLRLLFRWFAGLGIDDAVWSRLAFSKNRDGLSRGNVAGRVLSSVHDRNASSYFCGHGMNLGTKRLLGVLGSVTYIPD